MRPADESSAPRPPRLPSHLAASGLVVLWTGARRQSPAPLEQFDPWAGDRALRPGEGAVANKAHDLCSHGSDNQPDQKPSSPGIRAGHLRQLRQPGLESKVVVRTRGECSLHASPRPTAGTVVALEGMNTSVRTGGACPRCGAPLPEQLTGRPRIWCSQRCRRAAYEERRAAANGAIAVRVVNVVQTVGPHDLDQCVRAVAGSPTACRRLLDALAEEARAGRLSSDPRWEPALRALTRLRDELALRHFRPW